MDTAGCSFMGMTIEIVCSAQLPHANHSSRQGLQQLLSFRVALYPQQWGLSDGWRQTPPAVKKGQRNGLIRADEPMNWFVAYGNHDPGDACPGASQETTSCLTAPISHHPYARVPDGSNPKRPDSL
jgi:hypothetical protein